MSEEIYRVDFSKYPKPIQKKRMDELQELAFSKGISWCGTGLNKETHYQISEFGDCAISIHLNVKNSKWGGKTKYLGYNYSAQIIDYKEAIKRLRQL